MISEKNPRISLQKNTSMKTYEMSVGSDSMNVEFF